MTSDRSAKKAARARMAATGEPYSAARRPALAPGGPGHAATDAEHQVWGAGSSGQGWNTTHPVPAVHR
jgi:hypothetical protein